MTSFNVVQLIKVRHLGVKKRQYEWIKWITSKSSGGIKGPRCDLNKHPPWALLSFLPALQLIFKIDISKCCFEAVWGFFFPISGLLFAGKNRQD